MRSRLPFVVLALVLVLLIIGRFVPEPSTDFADSLLPPGDGGVAGTDHYGRSVVLTVWTAAGGSALAALITASATTLIGAAVGLVSTLSRTLSTISTALLIATVTVPSMLLTFIVVGILGGGREAIMVTVALTHWPIAAQLIGPKISEEWNSGWVRFDRRLGATRRQILSWHLLPAVWGRVAAAMAITFPSAVVHEATTSFLGIGVDPGAVSLGPLIAWGRNDMTVGAWWTLLVPTLALMLLLLPSTIMSRRLGERPRSL
ncbi:ABC transporter permease [Brevibacterium marinum]|uniref:Peptide/nickel transport system permease protein n=1 Tax=Brevibacterium marinum TaxID=418643 RepID=A0A846RUD1_9MICO|nr:ABC transporter permease subunit [Brevibacterium marinum]NJC55085.1 peptide/nickel transport system permease protein [Brevibacterium marinum]